MYEIKFVDGTVFKYLSDNLLETKWNEIPNKPIYSLKYKLFGREIEAKEYEAYNHCVEQNYNVLQGTASLGKVILMFKLGSSVERIIFDLIKKELYKDIVPFGQEYKNKAVTGWKLGVKVQ
jgi:hypothetical protein